MKTKPQPSHLQIFSADNRGDRAKLLVSALLLHTVFWSFAPPFFLHNHRPDTMEMMIIGQNWVISTYKHPAFQGWICEIYSLLFGRHDFIPYLAAQTACAITVLATWKLAQNFLSPRYALLAALAFLSYFYLHYDSTLYNNRTFMRSFWILALLFLYMAFRDNKKRYWILTGLALGTGIYCKFTVFMLVFSILLFMFLDPKARKYWKTPGPYLSTGSCFLICLPLLVWLVHHNFPQLNHIRNSIIETRPSFDDHFVSPIRFLVNQIPILLILLIPLFPVIGFRWTIDKAKLFSDKGRFLLGFLMIPLALQLFVAFYCAGNMRTALGCHIWLILPLFLLFMLKIPQNGERAFPMAMKLVFSNIVFFALLSIIIVHYGPVFTGKISRYNYPGKELAQAVDQIWQKRYSTPIPFVRGDDWPTEILGVYLHPHPTVYSDLWSTEEQFRKSGGVLLWTIPEPKIGLGRSIEDCFGNIDFDYSDTTGKPDEWLRQFPNAKILPILEVMPQVPVKVSPIRVGIAIVPPESETHDK